MLICFAHYFSLKLLWFILIQFLNSYLASCVCSLKVINVKPVHSQNNRLIWNTFVLSLFPMTPKRSVWSKQEPIDQIWSCFNWWCWWKPEHHPVKFGFQVCWKASSSFNLKQHIQFSLLLFTHTSLKPTVRTVCNKIWNGTPIEAPEIFRGAQAQINYIYNNNTNTL